MRDLLCQVGLSDSGVVTSLVPNEGMQNQFLIDCYYNTDDNDNNLTFFVYVYIYVTQSFPLVQLIDDNSHVRSMQLDPLMWNDTTRNLFVCFYRWFGVIYYYYYEYLLLFCHLGLARRQPRRAGVLRSTWAGVWSAVMATAESPRGRAHGEPPPPKRFQRRKTVGPPTARVLVGCLPSVLLYRWVPLAVTGIFGRQSARLGSAFGASLTA